MLFLVKLCLPTYSVKIDGEVWFWQNEEIRFYRLVNSQYTKIEVSSYLPNLSAKFLIEFINRGLTESPLTIKADFIS